MNDNSSTTENGLGWTRALNTKKLAGQAFVLAGAAWLICGFMAVFVNIYDVYNDGSLVAQFVFFARPYSYFVLIKMHESIGAIVMLLSGFAALLLAGSKTYRPAVVFSLVAVGTFILRLASSMFGGSCTFEG